MVQQLLVTPSHPHFNPISKHYLIMTLTRLSEPINYASESKHQQALIIKPVSLRCCKTHKTGVLMILSGQC